MIWDIRNRKAEIEKEIRQARKLPRVTYYIVLKVDHEKSIFINDLVNKVLVDRGCFKLVAGESWMKTYQTANGREFERIDRKDIFRMGEKNFKTIMYKKVLIRIGSHQEDLEVGVIEVEIPLLISKRMLNY